MNNKYKKHSKISESKIRHIFKLYSLDIDITKIAMITGVSRKTTNVIILGARDRIARHCIEEMNSDCDTFTQVKNDENQLATCDLSRKKKQIIFGIIKHDDKVYVNIINSDFKTIVNQLRNNAGCNSNIFIAYDGIVDFGNKKFHRITEAGTGHNNQIDIVECFWSYVKNRLAKFKGISPETFHLHLKESEFRFNHRGEDIYKLILNIIRNNPL